MPAPFAIYVRVSGAGGRENLHSPEDQEAAARAWAERARVDVCFDDDACVDLDVSGGMAAADRRLGRLIELKRALEGVYCAPAPFGSTRTRAGA